MKTTLGLVTAVILCTLGCGDAEERSDNTAQLGVQHGKQELHPVRWTVYGRPRGKQVRISSEVGYCAGTTKPRIEAVRVVEGSRQVLLTAMITAVKNGKQGCAGVGLGIQKRVELKDPLGGRALYDAGVSPPAKRWPRP